jgi:AraC-like DNA-binding protein
MALESLTFRIPEILSLVGLVQCVYVLVYMAFRAGDVRYAVLPGVYFIVLGGAFFLDFAQRFIADAVAGYDLWQWAAWFAGPPLSVLLIIQVAQITRLPRVRDFWVLLLPPLAFAGAMGMARVDGAVLGEWLVIAGTVAGGLAMLGLWLERGLLDVLQQEKEGRARFWLVMTLLLMNGAFLATMLLSLGPWLDAGQVTMIRTITGLGLVYLAGTGLFRIYPQSVKLVPRIQKMAEELSHEDKVLAQKIEKLLDLDKVYHEPTYSRSDIARELNVAETAISRVINIYFGKSFPQVLNERRVADAQRLLRETTAPVKQVAEEVGFNSMATFNRVFRDSTGKTPTEFRAQADGQAA